MKKSFVLMAFAVVLGVSAVPAAAQNVKIGYVDFQLILNESKRGQEAKDLLAKERDFRAGKLRESEDAFKKKLTDLEKKRTALSIEAFQKEQELLLQEREDLARRIQTFQQNLYEKEQELTKEIFDDVEAIIKQIAEKEGFTVVLEKQQGGIVFAIPNIDLTQKALQMYNGRQGGKKK
jgi:outer membrane protein